MTSLFGEEAPDILPYLATLLSLPIPEDLAQIVRHLDGEAMGRQIYRATRRFFAHLARERPTVVVFEDLHWLDGSSASLIQHLLPLTREVPVVFLLVSRPEQDTALARLQEAARADYADRLTEITLPPLSPAESAVLVRNLVRLDELPGRTRDAILAKTEGNPFFVEEVLRSLIDLGGLVWDSTTDHWRVTEEATNITIPDTLHGVIMARVDRLDDELKRVLRLASVIGRSFFYRVLETVAATERQLDESLAALEARELIREHVRVPEVEYVFRHALVQEATYESILLQRRRELHARVARAIETLFPDRVEEFFGLLAYHYTKAEAWEKSQDYLLAAGRQAGRIAADPETLAHFEQALEAHLRAHGGTWGDLISDEGIDWFLEWTDVLGDARRLRSVVSAVKTFHENVLAALGPEDRRVWAVAAILGRAYVQCGEPHEAEAILEAVLAVQDEVECSSADLARTLLLLGVARHAQDKFKEAEEADSRAMSLVRLATNPDACPDSGLVYVEFGSLCLDYGRWEEAQVVIAEGLSIPKLQPSRAYDLLLDNFSWLSWAVGDYEEAEGYARACMAQATHPLGRGCAEDTLGMVRLAQGVLAEAEEHLVAALKAAEPFGPTEPLVGIVSNVAEARLQAGRLEEAEDAAKRALGLWEDCGAGRSLTISSYWTLAGIALARGQTDEAERLLAECEAIGAKTPGGLPELRPEILYRQAQLRRMQGRGGEADGLVHEACRLLDDRRHESPHPRAEVMRAEWVRSAPG